MTRKFFSLITLSLALFGVFMLAASPNLYAQCCSQPPNPAPPAPNAPQFQITATTYPPNQQPTSITFNITMSDTTPGAWIYYTITNTSGNLVASGSIAPNPSTDLASGSTTVTFPIAQANGNMLKAYAQIPPVVAPACPTTPASPESGTSTANL
jgi:hypothetical protein